MGRTNEIRVQVKIKFDSRELFRCISFQLLSIQMHFGRLTNKVIPLYQTKQKAQCLPWTLENDGVAEIYFVVFFVFVKGPKTFTCSRVSMLFQRRGRMRRGIYKSMSAYLQNLLSFEWYRKVLMAVHSRRDGRVSNPE